MTLRSPVRNTVLPLRIQERLNQMFAGATGFSGPQTLDFFSQAPPVPRRDQAVVNATSIGRGSACVGGGTAKGLATGGSRPRQTPKAAILPLAEVWRTVSRRTKMVGGHQESALTRDAGGTLLRWMAKRAWIGSRLTANGKSRFIDACLANDPQRTKKCLGFRPPDGRPRSLAMQSPIRLSGSKEPLFSSPGVHEEESLHSPFSI